MFKKIRKILKFVCCSRLHEVLVLQVQQVLTKVTNLLDSLLTDMSPSIRKFVTVRSLTLDLLPLLLDILQPTLRPVSVCLRLFLFDVLVQCCRVLILEKLGICKAVEFVYFVIQ